MIKFLERAQEKSQVKIEERIDIFIEKMREKISQVMNMKAEEDSAQWIRKHTERNAKRIDEYKERLIASSVVQGDDVIAELDRKVSELSQEVSKLDPSNKKNADQIKEISKKIENLQREKNTLLGISDY